MLVNGVRVLPDLPRNMPNMDILIQEFETGFCSMSTNSHSTAAKSSTLSDGNFVKKIVEAYESSVRANENSQWERTKERSNFSNILDVIKNRKNVEKNSSSPAIYGATSSQDRNNIKKKSKMSLTSFEAYDIEDDFVILNQYHSESDVKTVSETWPEFSPKINMYSSMSELSMNVSSSSKKKEVWNLKKRNKKLEDKTKKNKLICSSPLEDNSKGKDLDCGDPLDDVLTSSCDSSSNNSYKNLQANLYGFKDEQFELSSSLSSLESFLSHKSSVNSDNGSLQDLSFQNAIVTSSKDITEDRENLRDSELVSNPSFNPDRKSPLVVDTSLNENHLIKTNSDNRVTWISTLGEKLSRKKPLKKLLKSTFNAKLLNYTKVWKKSAEKQPNERTSDSGFIERFLSASSSSSQKSWRSDLEKPPTQPTFGTFGHAKNDHCINDKSWSKSSRMVLTEVPRKEFTSDSDPSNSTSRVPSHGTIISCKENRENVESLSKSTMLTSSSRLKASCGYPPLRKHPYLPRNRIPKHPFVAKTKLDQTTEKESIEQEMRCDAKERESDMRELESSGTLPVSQAQLNILYSKMSEWSSPNDNYDLSR